MVRTPKHDRYVLWVQAIYLHVLVFLWGQKRNWRWAPNPKRLVCRCHVCWCQMPSRKIPGSWSVLIPFYSVSIPIIFHHIYIMIFRPIPWHILLFLPSTPPVLLQKGPGPSWARSPPASTHHQDAAHNRQPRDGVGHRHQGTVESWHHLQRTYRRVTYGERGRDSTWWVSSSLIQFNCIKDGNSYIGFIDVNIYIYIC